jgi:DNA-binding NarL/FixJ family response regulator
MNSSVKQSLMIIDDHPVYRDAISARLTKDLSAFDVQIHAVSSTGDGIDLIKASSHKWIVLLDILMPGLSGALSIKVFNSLEAVEHVVAISGLDEKVWEPKSVSAGATFFISKNNTAEFISKKLISLFTNQSVKSESADTDVSAKFKLTTRQQEVLRLVALGHPNKIIASQLEISEQTVKIHIYQIFKELKVFNRTQAVVKAQKLSML